MSDMPGFPDAAERLASVRARIARAAERAGRDPGSVNLVAVSKTFGADRVLALAAAGQRAFGENKVQEAADKVPRVAQGWTGPPLVWHGIGHLQRNKVKTALAVFDRLDAVDSIRLAGAIQGAAVARVPVLLQFNCSGEGTKSGFAPGDLAEAAARLKDLDRLDVRGLMTIARPTDDPEAARPDFARLRELRDELQQRWGRELPVLSMGMSHDLEAAVAEGATQVRVGTALFGTRDAQTKENDAR